ncbi:MAG: hypothetical protein COA45_05890 [Zetaproteobacteria bacterium]|nr:MAG: hypothetical protein COA45_05890 [Zetaproteobacteria bacterium]
MVGYFRTEKEIEESLQDDVRVVMTIEGDKIYTRQQNYLWDLVDKITDNTDIDHRIITGMAQSYQSSENWFFNEAYSYVVSGLYEQEKGGINAILGKKLAALKEELKRYRKK